MATASYYYKGSDEYIDAKCSPCADKNKDQIADHFCYDCEKHLCKACLGTHNSFIKDHIIVQGNGNDTDGLTEKCGVHEDELITLFCLQHKELICIQCRRQDHRTCKDVKHIKEATRQLSADTDVQAVTAQLQSELNNLQKSIEALDNDVASIKNQGSGFLKDLEVYAEKLLSRIKEMREKGKSDIKSKQDQLISNTKRYRQEYVLAKDEISRCLNAINKPNQLKANLFILKNKAKTITKKVDVLHNDSDSWIEGRQFNFMADMNIINSLKSSHSIVIDVIAKTTDKSPVSAVGGVVDSPIQAAMGRNGNSRGWRQRKKQESSPVETPLNKRVDETYKRPGGKPAGEKAHLRNTQVNNINVRIQEDKKCGIYGCCILSDGCLVIADTQNSRLKLIDPSSGTVTKSCDTNDEPWDVYRIGPQEVAVAFDGSAQVQVYNTESLAVTRTVKLGHRTSRIACHGGLLYCAELYGTILYVHDVRSGRKLREISRDTDGRELFSHITHIAVNSSGDRLFVADWERGLVCVGADGRRIFCLFHKDLRLSAATGVTTDHHGHVFVCGGGSHNVVKVTEDGHVVGQILSEEDGITWDPYCLRYDASRSRLYVGGRNSDQLLIVKWK